MADDAWAYLVNDLTLDLGAIVPGQFVIVEQRERPSVIRRLPPGSRKRSGRRTCNGR